MFGIPDFSVEHPLLATLEVLCRLRLSNGSPSHSLLSLKLVEYAR